MRIKSIHLKDYKRFHNLSIEDLPETARLIVLVGPNGSGKSSVFDSFLLKARAEQGNYTLEGELKQYYESTTQSRSTHDVASRVSIEFHDGDDVNMDAAFQVRSAYRNEADFSVNEVRAVSEENTGPRLMRIIDGDQSVSENYRRLAWQGLQDVHHDASENMTFGDYRKKLLGKLQDAIGDLFPDPKLMLQDFGGPNSGSFRFSKGCVEDFHYKNLSGGEKAAFDILLDVFMKRDSAKSAVFCIDEPELHIATGLQGRLIAAILKLLPGSAQLWVATHSIGIVREAYRIDQERPGTVAFLDFSDQNLDSPVTILPSKPNRRFWKNIYRVALDDLAFLIAPRRIVICEGDPQKNVRGFDAECYNELFKDISPETLFISCGGSKEVTQSKHLVGILEAVADDIKVEWLIDRDDMSDDTRNSNTKDGWRVLRRREIEDYLYDTEVLRTFLKSQDCDDEVADKVLAKQQELLKNQTGPSNIKEVSRPLFAFIRQATGISNLGNTREEFARQFLVVSLKKTPTVFKELQEDIFGES